MIEFSTVFVREPFKGILKRGYYKEYFVTLEHVCMVILLAVFYLFLTHKSSGKKKGVYILMKHNAKDNQDIQKKKLPLGVKIVIGFLIGVMVVCAGTFGYLQYTFSKMNKAEATQEKVEPRDETFEKDENEGTSDAEVLQPDEVELLTTSDIMKDKDVVNILLIGQDKRSGEGRARSDSMILATLNKKDKSIHLTSFMRDLYVELPGDYSPNRLNAAYQFGGMELLDATIESNFGILIDGNIEVDFSGFQKCVDKVGGIDIELRQNEADFLNKRGNWDVNQDSANTWQLKEGMNHLTGEQALAFSRIRYVGNADYERTERQRRVLTEVFKKVKSSDLKTIMGLIDELFPLLTTDISQTDMMAYAVAVLQIGTGDIQSDRIPISGSFKNAIVRKMEVLVPDLELNRRHLQQTLYPHLQE